MEYGKAGHQRAPDSEALGPMGLRQFVTAGDLSLTGNTRRMSPLRGQPGISSHDGTRAPDGDALPQLHWLLEGIVEQQLDPVASAVMERKHGTRKRIELHRLLDQCHQTVDAGTEVDRLAVG
jgi:hypothetical protein